MTLSTGIRLIAVFLVCATVGHAQQQIGVPGLFCSVPGRSCSTRPSSPRFARPSSHEVSLTHGPSRFFLMERC